MTRWPRRVPPVQVAVPCSGEVHSILWTRGSLVLRDHDAVADAVLVALGGEPPACLEVREGWRLGAIEEEPPAVSAGLVRSLSSLARWRSGSAPPPPVLPEPLRRLREASLLHTWGRGLRDHRAAAVAQGAFLERAVARRVRDLAAASMRASCGNRWTSDDVEVEVCGADDCGGAEATGAADAFAGGLRIHLPVTWLTRVWVHQQEVRDRALVLDTVGAPSAPTQVLALRWSPDGAGGWTAAAAWEDG